MKGIIVSLNFISLLIYKVYHYDMKVTNEELKVKVLKEVGGDIFDCTTFETWQMFVISNDGIKI